MATNEAYLGKTVIIKPANPGGTPAVPPVTSDRDAWVVFLSSTIGDLEHYRKQVQHVLLEFARLACFLSEDWINSFKF
jgi:hypothetical protein